MLRAAAVIIRRQAWRRPVHVTYVGTLLQRICGDDPQCLRAGSDAIVDNLAAMSWNCGFGMDDPVTVTFPKDVKRVLRCVWSKFMEVTGDQVSGGTRALYPSVLYAVDPQITECTGSTPTFMAECACQHATGEPLLVDLNGYALEYGTCRGWLPLPPEAPRLSHPDSLYDIPDSSVLEITARHGCQLIGTQGKLYEMSYGHSGGLQGEQSVCLYGQRWYLKADYGYSFTDEAPCKNDEVVTAMACRNSYIHGDALACIPLSHWIRPWPKEVVSAVGWSCFVHGATGMAYEYLFQTPGGVKADANARTFV
eukprot:3607745-Amphidinium_carterae.1